MISDLRVRQPREERRKCVNQYADTRMVHHRELQPRVAFSLRCYAHSSAPHCTFVIDEEMTVASIGFTAILECFHERQAHGTRLN
jgi:hypothetical protein